MQFKDLHPNVKIRIYASFIIGLAHALTFPFMAIYFAGFFGETITGLLLMISVVASIASGFIGGYYGDRMGRKQLMIPMEAIFMGAFMVMALANSPWFQSPVLTFVMFLVTNVCWGVYAPVDEAMLLDVTTAESRKLMYSIFYWMHNLTMAIGTGVGAFFFQDHKMELFAYTAFAVLISLLLTIFKIQETHFPERQKAAANPTRFDAPKKIIRNYFHVLKDATFMIYILAGMLFQTLETQLPNYIGIRLAKEVEAQTLFAIPIDGVKLFGFLQIENTILVVLLAGITLKVINNFPEHKVLYIGLFMYTFGYSVITYSSTPLILFGAMLIATIGEVMKVPVWQSYLGDIAPTDGRSSYLAVHGMAFAGSRVLASLLVMLGTILTSWQMGVLAFIMGAVAILLFRIIMADLYRRRSESSTAVPPAF